MPRSFLIKKKNPNFGAATDDCEPEEKIYKMTDNCDRVSTSAAERSNLRLSATAVQPVVDYRTKMSPFSERKPETKTKSSVCVSGDGDVITVLPPHRPPQPPRKSMAIWSPAADLKAEMEKAAAAAAEMAVKVLTAERMLTTSNVPFKTTVSNNRMEALFGLPSHPSHHHVSASRFRSSVVNAQAGTPLQMPRGDLACHLSAGPTDLRIFNRHPFVGGIPLTASDHVTHPRPHPHPHGQQPPQHHHQYSPASLPSLSPPPLPVLLQHSPPDDGRLVYRSPPPALQPPTSNFQPAAFHHATPNPFPPSPPSSIELGSPRSSIGGGVEHTSPPSSSSAASNIGCPPSRPSSACGSGQSSSSSSSSRRCSRFQEGITVGYTYDAFFVSDGRSRRRGQQHGQPATARPEGVCAARPIPQPQQQEQLTTTDAATAEGAADDARLATPAAAAVALGVHSELRPRYRCAECGKHYATSSNLSRHKQTHRSLNSQQARHCPHCGKVYVSMPALSMHILTHDLKYRCTVCDKSFSRPWLLQGHMRSHSGEKPFGCAHCGKAFADRSNLRAHMQTHSAFKLYACKRCGKSFALKAYLNKHHESACVRDDGGVDDINNNNNDTSCCSSGGSRQGDDCDEGRQGDVGSVADGDEIDVVVDVEVDNDESCTRSGSNGLWCV